jgi:hypothetical protein
MADTPRLQEPYANVTVPMSYDKTNPMITGIDKAGKVPIGLKSGKMARMELVLRGLVGSK